MRGRTHIRARAHVRARSYVRAPAHARLSASIDFEDVFSNVLEDRFDRSDMCFDSIGIASEFRGGLPWLKLWTDV